jgi:hypothetical protein
MIIPVIKNAPTSPTEYLGKQIIINSGRLVFNTTEDHLLLSSNKSINLNGVESVNTDTPLFVVQADKIYLGSKNADQPLLLGNNTKDLLNSLLIDIKTLLTVLSAQPGVQPGTPLEPTRTTAENMIPSINQLISDINEPGYLTSKDNFTS